MPSKRPRVSDLRSLFMGLQSELRAALSSGKAIGHPGAHGDATELKWTEMLAHLPARYSAGKAIVLDSKGASSDEIDIVVYDRHYCPFLLHREGAIHVPAESVYAVIEVKPGLSKAAVRYAGKKAASVRRLTRTSVPIATAEGILPPKAPFDIPAGIVALESTWREPLGERLVSALGCLSPLERIDFGCALNHGAFCVDYDARGRPSLQTSSAGLALITLFLGLLSRLQELGTVPALDFTAYMDVLDTDA